MKNLKYIIVPTLAAFMFTACNNEAKGPSQAELDTQVEAKVKAATDQLQADCDSRMMSAAQMQADSIVLKAAGKKVAAPVAAPKPAAPAKVPAKPTTKPTTKPVKPDTKPSNTVRPGSNQNNTKPATNTNRPGSNEGQKDAQKKTETPASNTSRPGANK